GISPASLRTRPLSAPNRSSSSSSSPRTSCASTDTLSLLLVARRKGVGMYTSTLIIALLAVRNETLSELHAEIALTSIAQHGDHHPVGGERLGDPTGRPGIRSRRDAHEQPFLARRSPRGRGGVLVAHQDHLVEHVTPTSRRLAREEGLLVGISAG